MANAYDSRPHGDSRHYWNIHWSWLWGGASVVWGFQVQLTTHFCFDLFSFELMLSSNTGLPLNQQWTSIKGL